MYINRKIEFQIDIDYNQDLREKIINIKDCVSPDRSEQDALLKIFLEHLDKLDEAFDKSILEDGWYVPSDNE
ncbi:MAG: hypothetical protein ACW99G_12880 [Candidatus Thorarchaeota archaeon]|jgi:hypothetical protein